MEPTEFEKRDTVMRAFFAGKDWDNNDEFKLKRSFVLRSRTLLPFHPFLIDDEWDVVPGRTNEGRCDLVFTDNRGSFAVVEVKFINNDRSGRTARSKRTDARGKVREQASRYASLLAAITPNHREVIAYAYTNESPDHLDEVERFLSGWSEESTYL